MLPWLLDKEETRMADVGRNISRRKSPGSVTEQRVRTPEGRMTTIRRIDARSPTFGEDMLYVFSKNVAAARRENKRVTGKADVAPAEG